MTDDRLFWLLFVLAFWVGTTSVVLRFWLIDHLCDQHPETWESLNSPAFSAMYSSKETSLAKRLSWLGFVYQVLNRPAHCAVCRAVSLAIVALDLVIIGVNIAARWMWA